MPEHDVAIYAPFAAPLYERGGRASGGGEQQAAMLAASLAAAGLRTAHIVFPVADPVAPPGVMVVQRPPSRGHVRVLGKVIEAVGLWRAMRRAGARVYVFRTGAVELAFGALFCRAFRRRLVFSSSSVVDFNLEAIRANRRDRALYRFGVRSADAVVVQTFDQVELARVAFGEIGGLERIPSFAAPAVGERLPGESFVWIGRLAPYKRPLEFVRLAAAVPDARFRMIGVEPAEYPAAYEEVMSAAEGLANLSVVGRLTRDEVREEMRRAVAVVSTSSAEGMPNVFLEAWSAGVPALSLGFDPDGVIEREGIGRVAGDSVDELAAAARELAASATERERLGDRACAYVTREHSPDEVGRRWAALVEPFVAVGPA